MASIVVEGYVQERRGKMLRLSEEYRQKDASGNWGNAGYGDFTVWLKDDDAHPEIQAGAVVLVSGDLRVSKQEKDGRTFTNLNVSFAKVGITRTTSKYQGGAQGRAGASNTGGTGDWVTASTTGAENASWPTDSDTPF